MLADLLGPAAPEILTPVLGIRPDGLRPTQIRYSPGRSATVLYSVDGSSERFVATTGGNLPSGAARLSDGSSEIAVWAVPQDPRLPGLRVAMNGPTLAPILREVGLRSPIRHLRLRSYRPTRRAVVEVTTAEHRVFLKVVRPDRVQHLQLAHRTVAEQIRVPRSLGWSPDLGIAVLEALPGASLRRAASQSLAGTLPSWATLASNLDQIPLLDNHRPGLIERTATHVRLLTAIRPGLAESLAELQTYLSGAPDEPLRPAHNDLHSEQILIQGDGQLTILDIDTVGPGRRVDDAALLIGHIYTHAAAGGGSVALAEYGSRLLAECEKTLDSNSLRLRISAAVLAFATTPFRRQDPDWPAATARRIDAARSWSLSH